MGDAEPPEIRRAVKGGKGTPHGPGGHAGGGGFGEGGGRMASRTGIFGIGVEPALRERAAVIVAAGRPGTSGVR
jgi:hypothetical protein